MLLLNFNIVHRERKACWVCGNWLLKFPVFQAPWKHITELTQTYFLFFFTGQRLENQQKHVHGLMHSRALQASLWERPSENPRIRILRTLLQEIFAKKSLDFITFQSNTIALAYLGITGSAKLSTEITLKSCFSVEFIGPGLGKFCSGGTKGSSACAWSCSDLTQ